MFNYNTYYNNYPNSMYGYRTNNYNTYTTSTNCNDSSNSNKNKDSISSNTNSDEINPQDNQSRTEKENKFRIGPLTLSTERIDIFGFSFAIDDLIIIGLMLIIFLDSDSDFVLLIILGLMLFNVSFSSLNLL